MSARIIAGLVMAACLTSGIGPAKAQNGAPASQDAVARPTQDATSTIPTDPAYKIGPQDMLRIDVWKEPDISRLVPVRPDGKITLPLLNDIQAAGLTPVQLSSKIAEGLKKYITSPQVTVGVTEINSRRIFVTGEVTRPGAFPLLPGGFDCPGAFPLLPNMTVLQALSSSGGFTQFARLKNIYVLRTEDGKQVKHAFNYKDAVSGKHAEQNIILEGGDVIVVP